MRRGFALLLPLSLVATTALALAACGDDDDDDNGATATTGGGGGGQGEDVTINVSDNKFEPAEATVGVNREATWEWSGSNPHSVVGTFAGEDAESPRLTGSGQFVFSFSEPGTFEYQCGVHGASMSGTITVE